MVVVKKNGTKESFSKAKLAKGIRKASNRALKHMDEDEILKVCDAIANLLSDLDSVTCYEVQSTVISMLSVVNPEVGKIYSDFTNYKQDFVSMLDDVYSQSHSITFLGDKENSNSDSALVSTKRHLIGSKFNTMRYRKFFLSPEERQAAHDGYVYFHDMSARLFTFNCCLFDMASVLKDGFEMGNIWYNEPKSLQAAFAVIGDVTLTTASQQYGGFTIPEVDKLLGYYAEKSYIKYLEEYSSITGTRETTDEASAYALKKVEYDIRQGYQGWEYKFNTVESSRGDYPFITITFGLGTKPLERLVTKCILNVHKEGQGAEGRKKPVLFPKLVFLYDEELHGEGGKLEDLFDLSIDCSSKAMYPDYLSLTGEGYVPSMYKKYKEVISPMGCRAFLSPYYRMGGLHPLNDEDTPVFVGRFNIGVISLNLPMILAKARKEAKDFYNVLDYYLEMIRQVHLRTYDMLAKMPASINPVCFCQGGFYKGNLKPNEPIKPLLQSATASFGYTALNELQQLYNKHSLVEDNSFALEVLKYINKKVEQFKEEDGKLYAIYGTPAENLCGLQVKQFRKLYDVIKGVSDREYVSNSFHCHVTEDINPIEKQDYEYAFWDYSNGGKIQYVRYDLDYNLNAIKTLVRRAMKMGYYEGVNMSLSYCNNCGYQKLNMSKCPKCGSKDVTKIDRMNGYLSYSRVHGDTRLNSAKMAEISERKSM